MGQNNLKFVPKAICFQASRTFEGDAAVPGHQLVGPEKPLSVTMGQTNLNFVPMAICFQASLTFEGDAVIPGHQLVDPEKPLHPDAIFEISSLAFEI